MQSLIREIRENKEHWEDFKGNQRIYEIQGKERMGMCKKIKKVKTICQMRKKDKTVGFWKPGILGKARIIRKLGKYCKLIVKGKKEKILIWAIKIGNI